MVEWMNLRIDGWMDGWLQTFYNDHRARFARFFLQLLNTIWNEILVSFHICHLILFYSMIFFTCRAMEKKKSNSVISLQNLKMTEFGVNTENSLLTDLPRGMLCKYVRALLVSSSYRNIHMCDVTNLSFSYFSFTDFFSFSSHFLFDIYHQAT